MRIRTDILSPLEQGTKKYILLGDQTLGTSTLKLWQQGVLMSCCQISTAYRLVVTEYEVPKVLVCILFFETPCSMN